MSVAICGSVSPSVCVYSTELPSHRLHCTVDLCIDTDCTPLHYYDVHNTSCHGYNYGILGTFREAGHGLYLHDNMWRFLADQRQHLINLRVRKVNRCLKKYGVTWIKEPQVLACLTLW